MLLMDYNLILSAAPEHCYIIWSSEIIKIVLFYIGIFLTDLVTFEFKLSVLKFSNQSE